MSDGPRKPVARSGIIDGMRPLPTSLLVAALANTGSLGLAAWLLDGFDVRRWWFVLAVVLFTVLAVALRRTVANVVPRFVRGSAIVAGLVLTVAALGITDAAVPARGFSLEGFWTWVAVTVMVWAAGVAYGEVDQEAPADAPAVERP